MKAVEVSTGREISVYIDLSYHNKKDGTLPIKFPENVWVKGAQSGTWYVNQEGYIIAGLSPEGYQGRFKVIL